MKRCSWLLSFVVLVVAEFFLAFVSFAEAPSSAEMAEVNGCQSAKCHADMGQKKFVHGPSATGDCVMCHELKGDRKLHKFKLVAQGAELCYTCHDRLQKEKVMHDPVNEGDCTDCHSPHESDNRFMLKASGSKLCFDCHDESIAQHKVLHKPVKEGDCLGCHRPHGSAFPKLLRAEGKDLCFKCHHDIQEAITTREQVHDPVEDGCDECHSSHGGPTKFMLKSKNGISGLCLKCHDELEDSLKLPVKHAPMTEKDECVNCHDPHASNFAPMLKRNSMDLCLTCHNKAYTKEGGETISNVGALLKGNANLHGPIRKKDCAKCHDPHGSKSFRLLKGSYPAKFYSPFSFENFGLCIDCHEKNTFVTERTTKLTEFRNGDLNLHFLHVNREKGRTCRACHETHASMQPKHIREKVPFGKWQLPTNFKLTNAGGSCQPGCHKAKEYSRDHPVKY